MKFIEYIDPVKTKAVSVRLVPVHDGSKMYLMYDDIEVAVFDKGIFRRYGLTSTEVQYLRRKGGKD